MAITTNLSVREKVIGRRKNSCEAKRKGKILNEKMTINFLHGLSY